MKKQSGFTLMEVIVVMGILAVLFRLSTVNLLGLERRPKLTATMEILVSDLQSQQLKAMQKEGAGGSSAANYGIHFETGRYILFGGTSYNPLDAANVPITLPEAIQIASVTFPSGSVVFASGSGEVVGFISGSNAITLLQTQNQEQETLKLNRYGVTINLN